MLAPTRADMYVVRDALNLADWASNQDSAARKMPSTKVPTSFRHPNYPEADLPYAGKLGHPAALSDPDSLMVAWGKGPCFSLSSSVRAVTDLGIETPGCDVGLYRTTLGNSKSGLRSDHPSDLEMIVDSTEWHEIMGRAVVSYDAIHGVEMPDVIERSDRVTQAEDAPSNSELQTGTPFGLLGAASIVDRETEPRDGVHFAGLHQFHQQGTDTINYGDDELCGVRILGVMPNRGTVNEVYNSMRFNPAGERIGILGEFSVREKGKPDTSFLVRMPANVPYFMQAIDCEGRTLNTDQTWQSLRPGERKTCGGCHVHSEESETKFEDSFAALDEYETHRIGEGTVPLLTGKRGDDVQTREVDGDGLFIDFETDIMPIFQNRCASSSCHGGGAPAAGLALDQPGAKDSDEYRPVDWSTEPPHLVENAFHLVLFGDGRATTMRPSRQTRCDVPY